MRTTRPRGPAVSNPCSNNLYLASRLLRDGIETMAHAAGVIPLAHDLRSTAVDAASVRPSRIGIVYLLKAPAAQQVPVKHVGGILKPAGRQPFVADFIKHG